MIAAPALPGAGARPAALGREADDVIEESGPLWRAHRTTGPHALGWAVLRTWGPVATCRWEPHPEPPGDHPDEGVLYTATDLATAVVESFDATHLIDPRTAAPRATAWEPTRPLRLLDLTDDWMLRHGATSALTSGPRLACRAWARRIRQTWPDLDGLRSTSVLTGRSTVTLWHPARDSFPHLPAFSEPLDGDLLWPAMDTVARRYAAAGYRLI